MSPSAVDPNTRSTNKTAILVAVIGFVGIIFSLAWPSFRHSKSSPASEVAKTSPYSGRVIGEDGKPIRGASIIASQDQNLGDNLMSDSNGQFQVQVDSGTASLRLVINANGYLPTTIQALIHRTGPEEIVLHPLQTPQPAPLAHLQEPIGAQKPKERPVAPAPNQNCPGGVCVGGDNNGTITVGTQPPPPRTVDPPHMQARLRELESIPGGGSVQLFQVGSEAEVHTLALAVYKVFRAAGWHIESGTLRGYSNEYGGRDGPVEMLDGHGISCSDYLQHDPSALATIAALKAMGGPCRQFHHSEDDQNQGRTANIKIVMGPQTGG